MHEHHLKCCATGKVEDFWLYDLSSKMKAAAAALAVDRRMDDLLGHGHPASHIRSPIDSI